MFFAIFAQMQFSKRRSVRKKKLDRRKRCAGVLVHTVLNVPIGEDEPNDLMKCHMCDEGI